MSSPLECPVCRRTDARITPVSSIVPLKYDGTFQNRDHSDSGYWIECKMCGDFVVTHKDYHNLRSESERSRWNIHQLSALVRERSIRSQFPKYWLQDGMAPYGPLKCAELSPINVDELLARFPRTVPERLDRTLTNLAALSPSGGSEVSIEHKDCPLFFAESPKEGVYYVKALRDQGWINEVLVSPWTVVLTPAGWARVQELIEAGPSANNPVFVAMSFGDAETKASMDLVYEEGLRRGIKRAGYKVDRVDQIEHNEWIMDQVMAGIRGAPFVVADFTGHRNGVYFEAGFAKGLGIPVICTCRDGELDKAHFDTRQLNHIVWKTPTELSERLYNRIIGTIGAGPFKELLL